jgi:hypothetical protein
LELFSVFAEKGQAKVPCPKLEHRNKNRELSPARVSGIVGKSKRDSSNRLAKMLLVRRDSFGKGSIINTCTVQRIELRE